MLREWLREREAQLWAYTTATPNHGDDGPGGNILDELGVEGLIGKLLVVLLSLRLRHRLHLHRDERVPCTHTPLIGLGKRHRGTATGATKRERGVATFALHAGDDVPGEAPLDPVGLDHDERPRLRAAISSLRVQCCVVTFHTERKTQTVEIVLRNFVLASCVADVPASFDVWGKRTGETASAGAGTERPGGRLHPVRAQGHRARPSWKADPPCQRGPNLSERHRATSTLPSRPFAAFCRALAACHIVDEMRLRTRHPVETPPSCAALGHMDVLSPSKYMWRGTAQGACLGSEQPLVLIEKG